MYDEPLFEAAFDTTLQDVSLNAAGVLSAQISRVGYCGLPTDLAQRASRNIHRLTLPLLNQVQHSRNEVALDLAARPLYRSWLNELSGRLTSWGDTPLEAAQQRLTMLEQLSEPLATARRGGWPVTTTELEGRIQDVRTELAIAAAEHRLQRAIASTDGSMASLSRLAAATDTVTEVPDSVARISERINELLPAATDQLLAAEKGVAGFQRLGQWREQYQPVVALASAETVARIQRRVDGRRSALADGLVKSYREAFHTDVLRHPYGLTALDASTAFEKRLAREASSLSALQRMQAFERERRLRREKDLAAAGPQLVAEVRRQTNTTTLDAMHARYVLPSDRRTATGREIANAVSVRQKELNELKRKRTHPAPTPKELAKLLALLWKAAKIGDTPAASEPAPTQANSGRQCVQEVYRNEVRCYTSMSGCNVIGCTYEWICQALSGGEGKCSPRNRYTDDRNEYFCDRRVGDKYETQEMLYRASCS